MTKIKYWIARILIYVFNKFPIKHNKVFLFSYYGAQYGCNPKYITNYINDNYLSDTFDIVWAFNEPDLGTKTQIFRKVKTMSLRYFYELCTSKVIITNYRTTSLFVKRKEQYYIQTWHSSLRLKKIEKDAEDVLPASYIQMAKKDSAKCDLLLSGCNLSTKIFQQSFWYIGEIFEHGTPRNDVLLQNKRKTFQNVLKKLKLTNETNILLYAPTFRKNSNLDVYDLDYKQLRKRLANKYGGNWIVLVKLHPHLLSKSEELIEGEGVMNVTTYDDIQELLLVADVLISDYSSLIFDYAITNRPCFLYVPDIDEYTSKERKLYFTLTALPFIKAISNKDLIDKIDYYDAEKYKKSVQEYLNHIGSFEEGKASEYLLKRIEYVCFEEGRDHVNEAI